MEMSQKDKNPPKRPWSPVAGITKTNFADMLHLLTISLAKASAPLAFWGILSP